MLVFRKLEDAVTGAIDGRPFNLPKTDEVIKTLEKMQEDGTTVKEVMDYAKAMRKAIIAGKCDYIVYSPVTKEYYLKLDDKVSTKPIPRYVADIIETSFEKGVDYLPVVKAWARLLNNPRYNDEMGRFFENYLSTYYLDQQEVQKLIDEENYTLEAAQNACYYQDIAITQEGLLATYKVAEMVTWEYTMEFNEETKEYEKVLNPKYKETPAVLDPTTGEVITPAKKNLPEFAEEVLFTPAIFKNGDKFYSGETLGYVYEVGKMQRLPKYARRNLRNSFGGGGLYIGGLTYIEGFHTPGQTHVLTCFVNPGDILSFQSEGHAIRVDALMPNNVWAEELKLKSTYHSSEYDKLSTKRLEDLIKQAMEDQGSEEFDFRKYQLNLNNERDANPEMDYSDEAGKIDEKETE